MQSQLSSYIGRFAPSPSGNLHFGSLVTALASYLQTRSMRGYWWLRIDDLDTPRNVAGAADAIQACLKLHGLLWDDLYIQSEHLDDYQKKLQQLADKQLVFPCNCSRKIVQEAGGIYPGTCRDKNLSGEQCALRFRNEAVSGTIDDLILGRYESRDDAVGDDFILLRRDGIYGYHLASVTDDINMGVTEIVRGADLLLPSICQTQLFSSLGANIPSMLHIPIACYQDGRKLSKQNRAPELDNTKASENLWLGLRYLGQNPPDIIRTATPEDILIWGREHWQIDRIPAKTSIMV